MPKQYFRGWAIPGPQVPGRLAPESDESLDALSGQFKIFQLKAGHRFSTDDLLTAWYATQGCPRADRVLDLGTGIGTVGMVAAWKLPAAQFVGIEAQEVSANLARKSIAYNGLEGRYELRHGDLRDESLFSEGESFDLVMGSPPYFPIGTGVIGDHPQKAACRFELRGSILDYCVTAAKRLAPGGVFACVFPFVQRDRVLAAGAAASLTLVKCRPVVLKEEEPPLLELYLWMRQQDLDVADQSSGWVEPPLIIRSKDGKIHPEYRTVKLSIGFPP